MNLEKRLKYYQFVSFDIFDTLIQRNVAKSTDVFLLMEEYCKINNICIPDKFTELRIQAEKNARNKYELCPTYDEIYNELQKMMHTDLVFLKQLEISFEIELCEPKLEMINIFNQCKGAGKKIVIVSDMYFSSNVLEKILFKCGIEGYEKIYVSSECKKNKLNGEIFEIVIEELGIRKNQLLHIGDNRKADFVMPLLKGISVHRVKQKEIKQSDFLNNRTLERFLDCLPNDMKNIEKLGARTLGPLLYGFCQWLDENLAAYNIENVCFLSRDGHMLMQSFELVMHQKYNVQYLYASRRSWNVPLIWKFPEFNDVINNIPMSSRTSLKSFLVRIGMEPEHYVDIARKFQLGLDVVFNSEELKTDYRLRSFYNCIREDVIKNSYNEYNAFLKYIKERRLKGRIAIVDIGYNGSMQYALKQLIKESGLDIEVYGFYVVMNPKASLVLERKIDAKGYLCEIGNNETVYKVISYFTPIFESVFLAQHGSVKRFNFNREGGYEVEFYEYEYKRKEGMYINEKDIIMTYQRGALMFVNKLSNSHYLKKSIRLDSNEVADRFFNMCLYPQYGITRMFGDFRIFDTDISYIARPKGILFYLVHPLIFVSDFMKCGWRIGFLYRLFKIPLPYKKMLFFLKEKIKQYKKNYEY